MVFNSFSAFCKWGMPTEKIGGKLQQFRQIGFHFHPWELNRNLNPMDSITTSFSTFTIESVYNGDRNFKVVRGVWLCRRAISFEIRYWRSRMNFRLLVALRDIWFWQWNVFDIYTATPSPWLSDVNLIVWNTAIGSSAKSEIPWQKRFSQKLGITVQKWSNASE